MFFFFKKKIFLNGYSQSAHISFVWKKILGNLDLVRFEQNQRQKDLKKAHEYSSMCNSAFNR